MYWNRSAADIATAWQVEIEGTLETGATAVLLGGAPSAFGTPLVTILSQQRASMQRNDVATPLLITGGTSAAWVALLLAPQPHSSPIAPPLAVIYGGADAATYLALVGITVASVTAPDAMKPTIPHELVEQVAPRLQPGAATAWETLPFVEVGELPTQSLALSAATSDPTNDWIAWGVMLLAFCLVLSALLI
jgi:hypothetical protein